MATSLVLAGDDKIGRTLLSQLVDITELALAVDRSSSLKRVAKLWWRGSLRFQTGAKMAWAEWRRPSVHAPAVPAIRSNLELLQLAQQLQVRRIYLFRAGLIISKTLLESGIDVVNVHCARLPDYAGLAVISRALANRDYSQCATMYHVTKDIDSGAIIDTEFYQLDPINSYTDNENTAYAAGIRLLQRHLVKNDAAAA